MNRLLQKLFGSTPDYRVKILFVCRANITRSPFLEGLMRKRIEERYPAIHSEIGIGSAGVQAFRNAACDPVIRFLAQQYGVDLLPHASKAITAKLVEQADYIFTLEESFTRQIQARFRNSEQKTFPLPMFGNSDLERNDWDVSDPTGSEAKEYEIFATLADEEAERILHLLENDLLGSKKNLVLIGLPGSGKSSAGEETAQRTEFGFLDTDDLVEKETGCSLQELVDRDGYQALRETEARVIMDLDVENTVISTGGSVVYSTEAMTHLYRLGEVVWLDAGEQTLLERIGEGTDRGLAKPAEQTLEELFSERNRLYPRWAQKKVSTESPLEETVETLVSVIQAMIAKDSQAAK